MSNQPKSENALQNILSKMPVGESSSTNENQKIPNGLKLQNIIRGHKRQIKQIIWSPDGELLASSSDDFTIRIWNTKSVELQSTTIKQSSSIQNITWSSDGELLLSNLYTSDFGDIVGCWNCRNGKLSTVLSLGQDSNIQNSYVDNISNKQYQDYLSDNALVEYLVETISQEKPTKNYVYRFDDNEIYELHEYEQVDENKNISFLSCSPNEEIIVLGLASTRDNSFERCRIELWDINTKRLICQIGSENYWIQNIKWSPDGQFVAIISNWSIQIWSIDKIGECGKIIELTVKSEKNNYIKRHITHLKNENIYQVSVSWSPDGNLIAIGTHDYIIKLWDFKTRQYIRILEGHTSLITGLSFSADGRLLASKSLDNVIIWRCDTWEIVTVIDEFNTCSFNTIAFHPSAPILATLGEDGRAIRVWDLDYNILLCSTSVSQSLHYVHAKAILVGESGVGKSGLGIRIAEKEFCKTESTHGAKFWQIPITEELKSLNKQGNIQAELTLWDLAGQPDYHLVHQLFLDDTDVALLLFDCSDAAEPFRGIPYWAKVLKKLAPANALKYLVSARCDVSPITVEQREINQIIGKYGLDGYFRTSAKTGEGVEQLLQQILVSIPWHKLPRTTTPKLFQVIREFLLERKEAGDTLIPIERVKQEVERRYTERPPTQAEIDTVVGLLQARGFVHRLVPTPNMQLVLLRPEFINQYASSIIQAARNHPEGIGSIPEREVVCANLPFDRFAMEERLPVIEEKLVLESTIELFIRCNLAFRELGRLVFPSQFNTLHRFAENIHPPTEVTYEFSGSIEAIYASLVVCLSYTKDFQRENLWKYTAEFSREAHRLGFAMEQVSEGTGELEIYFYPGVSDFDRVTFIRFITNHLHTKGIDIQERIRLYCPNSECRKEVTNREAIETRVKTGKLEIPCQYCDTGVLIPRSIEEKYRSDRAYTEKQQELQATVKKRTEEEVKAFQQDKKLYMTDTDRHIRILHLSDIHLGTTAQAQRYFTQLATDLTQNLNVKQLNYLVISGDIANRSTEDEYEAAFELVDKLVKRYGLDPNRIVLVPGNHDLNWELSEAAYDFVPKRKIPNPLPEGRYIDAGSAGALIRDEDEYKKRFDYFSDRFYKKIYNQSYPQEYSKQAILYPCPQDKILFLGLNSCWEIDHEYKDRAGINADAIAYAINQLLLDNYDDWLKIAIWHHPVNSSESMKNVAFLEQLAVNGFQLGIHGHIHEAKDEHFRYDPRRGLRIIAAGTFGAPAREQVTGIPLQYNLLTLDPESGVMTVETRKKEKADGAWAADARWGDKNNPEPRYKIELKYGTGGKTDNSSSQPKASTQDNRPNINQSIFGGNTTVGGNINTGSVNQSNHFHFITTNQTENSAPKRKILILASSPIDTARLRLDLEVREIDGGLRRAQNPDFSQRMRKSESETGKIYIAQVFQQFQHDPDSIRL
ncbi:metallophosphoesterase, partial [Calothrix sp. FACHB-156]|nr:metallophosphoesterase [Calothrix sp. FACHB-156]